MRYFWFIISQSCLIFKWLSRISPESEDSGGNQLLYFNIHDVFLKDFEKHICIFCAIVDKQKNPFLIKVCCTPIYEAFYLSRSYFMFGENANFVCFAITRFIRISNVFPQNIVKEDATVIQNIYPIIRAVEGHFFS